MNTRFKDMPRFPPGEYGQKYRRKPRSWALALSAGGMLTAIFVSLFIWYWFAIA